MSYILSREETLSVLHLLVEGNSLRSIQRLTGVHRDTVARLMVRVGAQMREFLDGRMRNLHLNHIQCDEIWTFVRKKQHRLTDAERDNPAWGDQYLFVALDEETKLVPTFAIGKRTTATTEIFMDDLAGRIVVPALLEPGERPMISTDGWTAYPNAVDGAFGGSVRYGVIIKDYQQAEQPGRYGPPEMVGAVRRVIQGNISRFDIMHEPCRKAQPHDPHVPEALHAAGAGLQQEARQPRRGDGAVRRPLQLLPHPRLFAHDARNGSAGRRASLDVGRTAWGDRVKFRRCDFGGVSQIAKEAGK
jgi:hypothetical protein